MVPELGLVMGTELGLVLRPELGLAYKQPYIHTYILLYTRVHTYTCVYIYTHTHTLTHTYTFTYMYVCIYIDTCTHFARGNRRIETDLCDDRQVAKILLKDRLTDPVKIAFPNAVLYI